ncbi:hypothetical protein BD413DRAFT_592073 [Trametes elegans]|nr:hypothetical protein BD413DRAFT_592073 [Trametes elegans]
MTVRRVYAQLWARTPPASEEDETHPASGSGYEDESSELSELDSTIASEDGHMKESTPDTEYGTEETKYDDDEDCCHEYQRRESVWVKPKPTSSWYQGTITKVSQPTAKSQRRGPLYLVVFRRYHTNLRAWFSPLEGNMKPDTPHIRALLQRPA